MCVKKVACLSVTLSRQSGTLDNRIVMGDGTIHGWLVFVSGCVVMIVPMGFMYSLGALFVPFRTVFDASRTEASLVQSVAVAVSLSTGFVHGMLIHKFGMVATGLAGSCLATIGLGMSFFAMSIYFLTVSIGIATSMGSICMYIVSSAAVGKYCSEKRALVLLSIMNAGSGLGGMTFPFILAFLSDTYSLHGALLICAGLVMNTIPCALLWTQPERTRETHKENNDRKSNAKHIDTGELDHESMTDNAIIIFQKGFLDAHTIGRTRKARIIYQTPVTDTSSEVNDQLSIYASIKRLVKDRTFMFFVLGLAFSYPPIMVLITFIADTFLDSGLTLSDANVGLLLLNACSILGRLLPGILMQINYIKAMVLPIIASLLAAVSMSGLILIQSLVLKLMFSCLAGISYGMFVSCFSVTAVYIVGRDQLGNAIGFAFTVNGIANIAAGPVSGYIRDTTGSYLLVFLLAGGVQLIAVLMFLTAHYYQQQKQASKSRRKTSIFYVTQL